ncbi:MAG: DJ-1/PfpI family protein [Pseudomonadota bacterium]|nr:DJ-1/PfpI family protein [Pseudomonadota bacterium]
MRQVVITAFTGVLALDITGPAEVFAMASRRVGRGKGYTVAVVSLAGGAVETASGIVLQTTRIGDHGAIDTLMVAGGVGAEDPVQNASLTQWIGAQAPRARRVCSVCTGAFILAAAGVLDGRRAVTHWDSGAEFRRQYPRVSLDLKPIYIQDGRLWTSAGVTAGIDLALALVEADHGRPLALRIAKQLVVFLHRPGGQAQFSSALSAQSRAAQPSQRKFAELHAWIADNLAADLSVDRLADHAAMARRSFTRAYRLTMGITPARAIEQIRIEAAKQALERGDSSVKQIAAVCGFGDEERLRRAFLRQLGVAPSLYRQRFAGGHHPSVHL